MEGLQGLRTLVTGATGGIGQAVVDRLAAEGARVVAADIRPPASAGTVAGLVGDVTDESDAAQLVSDARDALDGLDALVLAAGIEWVGPTHEMQVDDFDSVIAVSVRGTFLCLRTALPGFVEQRSGRIVTFGSTAGIVGAPGLTAYAAAKGAVINMTRSVAAEYAGSGIRANCLCPGGTDTPMLRRLQSDRLDPQAFARAHPIGRYAEAREMAAAVAFLLSDDASYFVGAAVAADGGFTAI